MQPTPPPLPSPRSDTARPRALIGWRLLALLYDALPVLALWLLVAAVFTVGYTLAGLLGRAEFCVGVDTGLTHFAAALGRPTVGVYVATNPEATGVLAPGNGVNVGGIGSPPSLVDVLNALKRVR